MEAEINLYCIACEKTFTSEGYLKKHNNLEHSVDSRVMTICNLHLRGDGPTYMECNYEEKMEIIQEMVDREAGQFWCWLL